MAQSSSHAVGPTQAQSTASPAVGGNEPPQQQGQEALAAAGSLLIARELRPDSEAADPRMTVPDPTALASRTSAVTAETGRLSSTYGVRPRNYRRRIENPRNDAEREFAALLPRVTAYINTRLAAANAGFRVTEAEIASNFLSEGGVLLLEQDQTTGIDGFGYAGIDTIVARYRQTLPFLHPVVAEIVNDPAHQQQNQNEQGQMVTSLKDLTLEQTAYANAGMYAAMGMVVERDLRARGVNIATMPPRQRVFWTGMYYNLGEGHFTRPGDPANGGRRFLESHGPDWYLTAWRGSDDHQANSMTARYNATLRTANWALLNADLDGPSAGATDRVGLPTAPVATTTIPLSQMLAESDRIDPELRRAARGEGPITTACDDQLAYADQIFRLQRGSEDFQIALTDRRQLALAFVQLRIGLRTVGIDFTANPTLTQILATLSAGNAEKVALVAPVRQIFVELAGQLQAPVSLVSLWNGGQAVPPAAAATSP